MRVIRIMADLQVDDLPEATEFYTGFLGMHHEELGLDWVTRVTSPETGAALQLLTGDADAAESPIASIGVDDVDAAYAEALRRGYEIVHPLTTQEWGVRRFFVRAPGGHVLNILQHRD